MSSVSEGKPDNIGAGGVQSIERALDLLECLARSSKWMGVSELSTATGQPVGTVHRLLQTLIARDYVVRDSDTRRYALGPAFRLLASSALISPDWNELATPLLRELAEISGETANLAVLERDHAVYMAQAQPARMVRMFTELGHRAPLHCSACGKVLLAYLPESAISSIMASISLPAYTHKTIINLDQLCQELATVRQQGYATDDEEQEEGVRCIAVPVYGSNGNVVAAISISGPSSRLGNAHTPALLPHLQRISTALTTLLAALPGHIDGR